MQHLNNCIYSLLQATRQNVLEILKKSGSVGGNANEHLNVKQSIKGIVYVELYVYDNLMIGDKAITALKENGLVLKLNEGLQDYLSSEHSKDNPISSKT